MKHTITFLTALLLAPLASLGAETSDAEADTRTGCD